MSYILDAGPDITEYEEGIENKALGILVLLHLLLEITTLFLDKNFKVKKEIPLISQGPK